MALRVRRSSSAPRGWHLDQSSNKGNLSWRGSSAGSSRRLLCRLERRRDRPSATRRRIGQALALRTQKQAISASQIVDAKPDPVVVSEIEFGCVAVQMLFADM